MRWIARHSCMRSPVSCRTTSRPRMTTGSPVLRSAAQTSRRPRWVSAIPSSPLHAVKVDGRFGARSFFLAVLFAWASMPWAQQGAAGPYRDLYLYKGADRDQRVLQGAKKERQAVVYTSLNLKDSVPIAEAFEKTYGVKLQLWRSSRVKATEVPNSYEDLLHPRWVGRIGIEAGDTDWFGSIVKLMGEDKGLAFFRKLSQMKPQIRTGHTLMAELVASGEIPLAATIYNHNAERLLVNGAPIKWKALTPTFGRPN